MPDDSSPQQSIRDRFPNMQPVESAPSLFTLNGFGVGVYGKRDFDPVTGTYVKTHCLCALFIPLIALGAYRVADAERGWYFIGKEPLSKFARGWNWTLLGLILMFIVGLKIDAYTSSPAYVARKELKLAAENLQAGNLLKAAAAYKKLVTGPVAVREEAKRGLQTSLEQCLQSNSAGIVAGGFRVLAGLPDNLNKPAPLVPDALKRGLALVEKFGAKDPEAGLKIFEEVSPLDPKSILLTPLRIDLLKKAIATDTNNVNRVVELSLVYESTQQPQESVKVLRPYGAKLGSTEGARILGQQLLQQGQYEESYALLFPYVQVRLEKVRTIEKSYTNLIATVNRRAIRTLKEGGAGKNFYDAYNKASKAEQENMVDGFIQSQLKGDSGYQRLLGELAEASRIVNVALDLGVVQLNRAQNLRDQAARKTELEAAEKTFLSIRGFAGGTDEYKLFFGQVCYWLGKSKEGKDLFDQLLEAKGRSFSILMALGRTLREVGDFNQARELAEEGYRNGQTDAEKHSAAAFRAHVQKDVDDQIAWLQKSDTRETSIQIALNNALGEKAVHQGDRRKAAEYLRKAIDGYTSQPKSAAVLNNCGLSCLSLYEVTGDLKDHERGLAMLEEAIGLDPGNSVLLVNTARHLMSRAVMDVIQNAFRLDQLGAGEMGMLGHLYADEAGEAKLYNQLRANESMKKALAHMDKALLLAPKELSLYRGQLQLHTRFHDLSELQKLQQRFTVADIDTAAEKKEVLEVYSGVKDKEYLENYQTSIQKLEKLLQAPEVTGHPATFEYVTASLSSLKQNAVLYGLAVDSRRLLDSARAAYEKHPCTATHGELVAACFFHANEELARQSPEYATVSANSRKSLSPRHLMAFLLEQGGSLAGLIRKNPTVVQALALEKSVSRSFPSYPSAVRWALFRQLDPEEAALVAKRLKENETARLADQLEYQLDPFSPATVLEQYWTHKMLGDEKKGLEIYQAAIREGVPLPAM